MLCFTPAYLVDSVCIRHCVKEWERVSNNRKPVKRRSTYKVNTEATVKSSRMGVWKMIPDTLYFRKWNGWVPSVLLKDEENEDVVSFYTVFQI